MTTRAASRPSSPAARDRELDLRDGDAVAEVCAQLERGVSVRRALAGGGRLHIERALPFLVLYRQPRGRVDLGTTDLVVGQPAHLITHDQPRSLTARLVRSIVSVMRQEFGAFLLLEVSCADETPAVGSPDFAIYGAKSAAMDDLAEVLERRLHAIKLRGRVLHARTVEAGKGSGMPAPLFNAATAAELGCLPCGVVVSPLYRSPDGETTYPAELRKLSLGLGRALGHTFFRFATEHTGFRPPHFHALGRRIHVHAVSQVDERLAEVARSFNFLLSINPIGVGELWNTFRKNNYDVVPSLRYGPLTIDPVLKKRELYAVPIERIEDPTLSHLFYEKQAEIGRKLTMLLDRGSTRFLLSSTQLYGRVDGPLLRAAEEVLERLPARSGAAGGMVSSAQLLEHANREIAHYRRAWPGFTAEARLSADVLAGMMVSRGELLVSSTIRTPTARVDALLQHEVGTHLVTYFNGGEQRFRHLQLGLAGYHELQEGLAVFAEYAAGGMTPGRLRILAARVIGAHMLMEGADFVDVFRAFCRFGFARRASFGVALRLFRGGGYTKDLIYLRGLLWLLRYLEGGAELEPLFVGKIGTTHIPIVTELLSRGILTPPQLLPRYLSRSESHPRIERARGGLKLHQLVDADGDTPSHSGQAPR